MAVKLYTLAQITVATSGTEQQVSASATPVTTLVVSAPASNSGTIYLGDSNVTTTRGIPIPSGTTISITADMSGRSGGEEMLLSNFYIDAATNGDKANVSYIARL